jgi:hypothetical protein
MMECRVNRDAADVPRAKPPTANRADVNVPRVRLLTENRADVSVPRVIQPTENRTNVKDLPRVTETRTVPVRRDPAPKDPI